MPYPKIAIVIGSPADLPVREQVEQLAKENGFEFFEAATHQEATDLLLTEPQLGSSRALMLLCEQCVVHDSLPNAAKVLRNRWPRSGTIVVCAQDQLAGTVALDCIQAGVYDYLVPDYDRAELLHHIGCAFQGGSPYAVYKGITSLVPGDKIFIATPYDLGGYQDYYFGVSVALTHLKLEPVLASDGSSFLFWAVFEAEVHLFCWSLAWAAQVDLLPTLGDYSGNTMASAWRISFCRASGLGSRVTVVCSSM